MFTKTQTLVFDVIQESKLIISARAGYINNNPQLAESDPHLHQGDILESLVLDISIVINGNLKKFSLTLSTRPQPLYQSTIAVQLMVLFDMLYFMGYSDLKDNHKKWNDIFDNIWYHIGDACIPGSEPSS